MKIRRFFGKDMREALRLVKAELGSEAVIMSNRKVADGVELVAAYDKDPQPQMRATPAVARNKTPTLSEIIGDDGSDSLKALLEKQAAANASAPAVPPHSPPAPAKHAMSPLNDTFDNGLSSSFEDILPDTFEAPVQHTAMADIKQELASLREILQHQMSDLIGVKRQQQRPFYHYVSKNLLGMGLSERLASQLIEYTPAQLDEQAAYKYALHLLANRLLVSQEKIHQQQGVIALVGPTGTGKTTTVAKIAARAAQQYGAEQVAMVTIDSYRIAAFEQLATYGRIIGCQVKQAATQESLAETLYQLRHKRLVLIDTAGFSQRDERLLGQLQAFAALSHLQVKPYLLLSACAQLHALEATVQAYANYPLAGCILTKLDECYSLGAALTVMLEHQLSLHCVTDGQQVPEDIKTADAKTLVSIAARLYKKYVLNHTTRKQA